METRQEEAIDLDNITVDIFSSNNGMSMIEKAISLSLWP